jgi:hypothetical protein
MIYKVLKPFFKLSERKNYAIDETIELSKEDAEAMLNDGYLEQVKDKLKKVTKDDTDND